MCVGGGGISRGQSLEENWGRRICTFLFYQIEPNCSPTDKPVCTVTSRVWGFLVRQRSWLPPLTAPPHWRHPFVHALLPCGRFGIRESGFLELLPLLLCGLAIWSPGGVQGDQLGHYCGSMFRSHLRWGFWVHRVKAWGCWTSGFGLRVVLLFFRVDFKLLLSKN